MQRGRPGRAQVVVQSNWRHQLDGVRRLAGRRCHKRMVRSQHRFPRPGDGPRSYPQRTCRTAPAESGPLGANDRAEDRQQHPFRPIAPVLGTAQPTRVPLLRNRTVRPGRRIVPGMAERDPRPRGHGCAMLTGFGSRHPCGPVRGDRRIGLDSERELAYQRAAGRLVRGRHGRRWPRGPPGPRLQQSLWLHSA